VLRIANIKGNEWMLPIELDSIKRGLEFGEKKDDDYTYTGYFNADGEFEGAGVKIWEDDAKECGEYHCGESNGISKLEFSDGGIFWGQIKDGNMEGYGTMYNASSRKTYTGQYKNDNKHGYGHIKWEDDGIVYYGQWKEWRRDGHGF
jgi:hypothetical protein